MDITQLLKSGDSNLLIFLLTSLIAFIAWIVKGAIERPINNSKKMFEDIYTIRIEILTEIKNRLTFILYFKDGKENKNFKEQIQELLLKDGKTAYLSKNVLDNTLRISIDQNNNDALIKDTISLINTELYLIISKIEDEINFYRKFSNYNPLKKAIGIVLLAIQYIMIILLIGIFVYLLVVLYIDSILYLKILIILITLILLVIANWWLSKK